MELVKFDFSAISNYYNARINYRLASSASYANSANQSASAVSNGEAALAPDALPWRREVDTEKALIKALGAQSFISDSAAKDARSESGDVPKIILAYEALAQAKIMLLKKLQKLRLSNMNLNDDGIVDDLISII